MEYQSFIVANKKNEINAKG